MRQLISFLGSGKYFEVTYDFEGEKWQNVTFLALAMAQRLSVDRFVLFGTPGSMWDVLLSQSLGDAEASGAHHELMDSAARQGVRQEQLLSLRPLIEGVVGCQVELVLTGECRTGPEQMDILTKLASLVTCGDRLVLDVTHGYRHQPMLALVAAAYLRRTRGTEIERIAYGALPMQNSDGSKPVLDLRGLLDALTWIEALAAYDASGDLGVFAGPLGAAGLEPTSADRWRRAAFHERNLHAETAAPALAEIAHRLPRIASPMLQLFQQQLQQLLAWAQGDERWQKEWDLGRLALERGDYLRAAILLTEATISRCDPGARSERRTAEIASTDYIDLKHIRNSLAHATLDVPPRIARLVKDPAALRIEMRRLADAIAATSLRGRGEPA